MNRPLLLIEDDPRLAAMLSEYLGNNGFALEVATTGRAGLSQLAGRDYALLLLDLTLPDIDGLDVCKAARALPAGGALPILMLTARGDAMDRVLGLELGADDYLAKPFEPRELLARIRALLRRHGSNAGKEVLRFDDLEIDRAARRVRVGGEERPLTGAQFDLLLTLAESAGRVLSREQLMERARGEALDAFDRSIDVHISRIRAAIEDDPKHPRRILTLRGAGYLFVRGDGQ
jgi:DNA-binding response OmpR family regulator